MSETQTPTDNASTITESHEQWRSHLIGQALAIAPRSYEGALKRARSALEGADEAILIKAAELFKLPENSKDAVEVSVLFGALMDHWARLPDGQARRIAFDRIGALRFKQRFDGSVRPEGAPKPDDHDLEMDNSAWRRVAGHWMRSAVELARGAKIPKELLNQVTCAPCSWLSSANVFETPDLEAASEQLITIRQMALRKWSPSSDDALENASKILLGIEQALPADAAPKTIARELDHLSCMLSLGYGRRAVELSLQRLSQSEVAQAFLGELLPGMAMAMASSAKAPGQKERPATHGSWRSWTPMLALPVWQAEALGLAQADLARVACEKGLIEAYHAVRPKGPPDSDEEAFAIKGFGLPAWSRMQKKWIESKTERASSVKAPSKRL